MLDPGIFSPEERPLLGSEQGILASGSSGEQYPEPWDETADVVVLGFGAAGACAALEAAAAGARVLAADRFFGGGASQRSGGVIYLGGGTMLQQQAGYEDSAEEMWKYLSQEVRGAVDAETLRAFCAASVANFEWLRALGVPFPRSGEVSKCSYPADFCTLYYSGNETSRPYSEHARPAPRGHRPHGKGLTGKVLYASLSAAVARSQIVLRHQTRARRLVMDAEGRVIGVELRTLASKTAKVLHRAFFAAATNLGMLSATALRFCAAKLVQIEERYGRSYFVRANGGIVLCTGGFVFNPQMMHAHASAYAHCRGRLGTAGDAGDGIKLGLAVGAATANLERCGAFRFINPPSALTWGVLIGGGGERVCNEELYGGTICDRVALSHAGRGFLILDAEMIKAVRAQLAKDKMSAFQRLMGSLDAYANLKKAATLEQLGARCGMPAGELPRTIAAYNRTAAAGEDPLGKSRAALRPLLQAPFYAVDFALASLLVPTPVMTLGGLSVKGLTAEVRRRDGTPIPGLYAAGRAAAGVASYAYVSGLSLADCIFSGRTAGQSAAARALRDRQPANVLDAPMLGKDFPKNDAQLLPSGT